LLYELCDCAIASVAQEVKKEKVAPTAEPAKVRPGGGVGVSELRDKLGHMMMHPTQHHAPTGPPGIVSLTRVYHT